MKKGSKIIKIKKRIKFEKTNIEANMKENFS